MDATTSAALVTAAATAVLVAVTWRYMRLTRELVQLQQMQLDKQTHRENEQLRRTLEELDATLAVFTAKLKDLPRSSRKDRADSAMRGVVLWSEATPNRIESLAAAVGGSMVANGYSLANALREVAHGVRRVQSVHPDMGYDWSRFPWSDWDALLLAADDLMATLRGDIRTAQSGETAS